MIQIENNMFLFQKDVRTGRISSIDIIEEIFICFY